MKEQLRNLLSMKTSLIREGKWTAENLASVCQNIDDVDSIEISNRKDSILLELNKNYSNHFNFLDNPLFSKIHSALSDSYPTNGFGSNMMANISLLPNGNKAILYL